MNKRPQLNPGDLVKLSTKTKANLNYNTNSLISNLKNKTMMVCEVEGDSAERSSIIKCKVNGRYYNLYRDALWFTGKNISDINLSNIENNDGRLNCFICGQLTQLEEDQDKCNNTSCSWYKK